MYDNIVIEHNTRGNHMVYEVCTVEFVKTINTQIGPMKSYKVTDTVECTRKLEATRLALELHRNVKKAGLESIIHIEVMKRTADGLFGIMKLA